MNKLYVVGIGPGAYEKMTIEAAQALKNSDVIIGYTGDHSRRNCGYRRRRSAGSAFDS